MKATLIYAVLVTLVAALMVHACASALEVPDVHISYSTGECVKIIDEQGERECPEELPAKYHRVWVY